MPLHHPMAPLSLDRAHGEHSPPFCDPLGRSFGNAIARGIGGA